MLTQRGVLFVAHVTGDLRSMDRDDVSYLVLPLSHAFGLSSLWGTLRSGGCVWLVSAFDADHLLDALAQGVTVFQGVPAMYAKILSRMAGRSWRAPRLRYLSSGGSAMDSGWKKRIESALGAPVCNGYGLTETSPTFAQTLPDEWRDDDSVGAPLPGLEARIVVDEQDALRGAVGELWVRGPTVFAGYYRDSAATTAAFTADGWFKTGDLARQDADGSLFIAGRCKELIIRSGFNVMPVEVELALNQHPNVQQSAVLGRPVGGNEDIFAFVEPRPGRTLSAEDLARFIAGKLAPYKRPQHVVVLDALPSSGAGKVLKRKLSDIAGAMLLESAQK